MVHGSHVYILDGCCCCVVLSIAALPLVVVVGVWGTGMLTSSEHARRPARPLSALPGLVPSRSRTTGRSNNSRPIVSRYISFGVHPPGSATTTNSITSPYLVRCRGYSRPLPCCAMVNSYSPSGEVTAPLIYANYGRPEDFDALEVKFSMLAAAVIVRFLLRLTSLGYAALSSI